MSDKLTSISCLLLSAVGWFVFFGGVVYFFFAPYENEFSLLVNSSRLFLCAMTAAVIHLVNCVYGMVLLFRKSEHKGVSMLGFGSSFIFVVCSVTFYAHLKFSSSNLEEPRREPDLRWKEYVKGVKPAEDSLAERVLHNYQSLQTYSATWIPHIPNMESPSAKYIWDVVFERETKRTLFCAMRYPGPEIQAEHADGILLVYDGKKVFEAMTSGWKGVIQRSEHAMDPNELTYRDLRRFISHLYPFDLPLIFSDSPFEEVIQSQVGEIKDMSAASAVAAGFEVIPTNPNETRLRFLIDPNSFFIDTFYFIRPGTDSKPAQFQCEKVVANQPLADENFNIEKQMKRFELDKPQ